MNEVFITKVNQSATEEGNVVQKVEMVFKHIDIVYKQQGVQADAPGALSERRNVRLGHPRPARRRLATAAK